MAGNHQQYFSSYYNQYHSQPPLSEDDDRPEELDYYDDEDDSQADSYSDYSMGTASGSSAGSIAASSYSCSDMSISITSDDIHPHDSVSQRGFDQKSVVSDAPSVLSYHAGLDDHLFREIFGRAFHSQNDGYMLPADSAEHNRLDVQHTLLRLVLGNCLYAAPDLVRKALSPHQQERPSVLDIGTGSGRWAIEMAAEFPHAEVVGLDLVPPTLAGVNEMPANCRFEVDDANLPLEHYASSFNVCHVRSAEAGIHDFDNFLYNVAQILRPNGVLLLSTGSPQLYDENFQPIPVAHPSDPNFSWIQRVIGETFIVYRNRGNPSCEAGIHWHGWLEKNPNFYGLQTQDVYIPLGPWTGTSDERQTYIAELMRYDISHALHSFKPMILMDGLRQDVVDRMVDAAILEMRDLKLHAYVRWRYTWAIRKDTPWCERLEAPRPIEKMSALTFTPRFEEASRCLETRNSIAVPA